jgi:LDH2 family malate/lactate/ureidoglycolate dehydrogenase
MTETSTLTIAALHERVEAIFLKHGLSTLQAGAVARVIVAGERMPANCTASIASKAHYAQSTRSR